MNTLELVVIVRHGRTHLVGEDPNLTTSGKEQMRSVGEKINTITLETYGETVVEQLFMAFSHEVRALESIQEIHWKTNFGTDIVVTDLYYTKRSHVTKEKLREIVQKVTKLANFYEVKIVTIVAHGEMPAMIAETAHEMITGNAPEEHPDVNPGAGFIINMQTGKVVTIEP